MADGDRRWLLNGRLVLGGMAPHPQGERKEKAKYPPSYTSSEQTLHPSLSTC